MVHMLPKDLKVINNLGTGARESLNDALRIAVQETNAFAFEEFAGRDEFLAIFRPDRVSRRATDRLLLPLNLKINRFLRDMLERPGYEIPFAGNVYEVRTPGTRLRIISKVPLQQPCKGLAVAALVTQLPLLLCGIRRSHIQWPRSRCE